MRKYIIEKLKSFRQYFIDRRIKYCEHGFEISEVINTKIDPTCKKCGQKLSVLKNV